MWYRKSADQGDTRAQYNLGVLYVNGEGVEKDLEQAASLWRNAGERWRHAQCLRFRRFGRWGFVLGCRGRRL